jgi:hypothetical protein
MVMLARLVASGSRQPVMVVSSFPIMYPAGNAAFRAAKAASNAAQHMGISLRCDRVASFGVAVKLHRWRFLPAGGICFAWLLLLLQHWVSARLPGRAHSGWVAVRSTAAAAASQSSALDGGTPAGRTQRLQTVYIILHTSQPSHLSLEKVANQCLLLPGMYQTQQPFSHHTTWDQLVLS